MFGLGIGELLIILAIVVLVFGAARIPQLTQGVGQGLHNFRKSLRSGDDDE